MDDNGLGGGGGGVVVHGQYIVVGGMSSLAKGVIHQPGMNIVLMYKQYWHFDGAMLLRNVMLSEIGLLKVKVYVSLSARSLSRRIPFIILQSQLLIRLIYG